MKVQWQWILGFIAVTISSYLYCLVAYDKKYENNGILAYSIAILAAIISVAAWTFIVRNTKDPNTIMIVNCAWDVGVTLMVLVFPLFMFDFKLETKTIIGCVISTIGLIIAKL